VKREGRREEGREEKGKGIRPMHYCVSLFCRQQTDQMERPLESDSSSPTESFSSL